MVVCGVADPDVSVEIESPPPPEVTVNIEEETPPEDVNDSSETVVIVPDETSPVEEISSALALTDQLRQIVREEVGTAVNSVTEMLARHNHPEYEHVEPEIVPLPEPIPNTDEEEEEEEAPPVHPWFRPIGRKKK